MMWTRSLLTMLACTQLSLVAMQHYRAPQRVVAPKPHPEGVSSLVDRIANSKYGLLGPLPSGSAQPAPSGRPLDEVLIEIQPAPVPVALPAQSPNGENAPVWLWPIVDQESRLHGLDPFLVESVIKVESGFQPDAVSPAGAQGLMQLMPETARLVGVNDAFDPQQNVAGGSQYLAWQLQDFGGDMSLALAAYNAGPAAVRRWGGIPPYGETTNYVRSVMEDYRRKQEINPSQDYPR